MILKGMWEVLLRIESLHVYTTSGVAIEEKSEDNDDS